MDGKRSFTGWELEGQIRRVLADAPPGTPYCVLCLAEALEITSVQQYVTIAQALRRVGTYQPTTYETVQGKCPTHTGHSGTGTFWMIGRREDPARQRCAV